MTLIHGETGTQSLIGYVLDVGDRAGAVCWLYLDDRHLNRQGILKLRGQWTEAFGLPTLPMAHPAYLLRTPLAKREAWADLLSIAARLEP